MIQANKTTLLILACLFLGKAAFSQTPREPLEKSGIKGGLVVQLGCGDGAKAAELAKDERFIVQGLDTDDALVEKAFRAHARPNLYFRKFDGTTLPYRDNTVNLIIIGENGQVPRNELERALVPGGVIMKRAANGWERAIKKRPETLDSWTHYLYKPHNNAVSRDQVVGPTRGLQWRADPKYSRNHECNVSFQAMVADEKRVFYIIDEGSRSTVLLPPEWKLVARDAFNGIKEM